MDRTELVSEILKLTGHKRSLHPDVHFGIVRLIDKYEKAYALTVAEKAVEEVYTGHTSDKIAEGRQDVANRILSRIKQQTGGE